MIKILIIHLIWVSDLGLMSSGHLIYPIRQGVGSAISGYEMIPPFVYVSGYSASHTHDSSKTRKHWIEFLEI